MMHAYMMYECVYTYMHASMYVSTHAVCTYIRMYANNMYNYTCELIHLHNSSIMHA